MLVSERKPGGYFFRATSPVGGADAFGGTLVTFSKSPVRWVSEDRSRRLSSFSLGLPAGLVFAAVMSATPPSYDLISTALKGTVRWWMSSISNSKL